MLSREAALQLVEHATSALDATSYEIAARRAGLPPGLLYLIATGVPADSSDGLSPEDLARPGLLGSAQRLVLPPVDEPDRGPHIREFLRRRVASGRRADDETRGVPRTPGG